MLRLCQASQPQPIAIVRLDSRALDARTNTFVALKTASLPISMVATTADTWSVSIMAKVRLKQNPENV